MTAKESMDSTRVGTKADGTVAVVAAAAVVVVVVDDMRAADDPVGRTDVADVESRESSRVVCRHQTSNMKSRSQPQNPPGCLCLVCATKRHQPAPFVGDPSRRTEPDDEDNDRTQG